jgi:hypothetical protein
MKNTSKYLTESLSKPSPAPMKNKARLSIMTAFSFGKQQVIHQLKAFKRASVMTFLLRFTSQNETSKNLLIPALTIGIRTMMWRTSP